MLTEKKPRDLSLDTLGRREGVHLWVGGKPYNMADDPTRPTISVHLNRDEALWLMRELERRLF